MPVTSVTYTLQDLTAPFRVNTNAGGNQTEPAATALANGGFAIGYNFLPSGGSVGLDFFKSPTERVAVGVDQFPDPTASDDYYVSLTQLSNGNVLAAWSDQVGGGKIQIHGRLYTQDGISLGTELTLLSLVGVSARSPHVVARPDGGFLMSYEASTSIDDDHIYVSAFDDTGHELFYRQVSQADSSGYSDNDSSQVVQLAGGGFAVAYRHYDRSGLFTGPGSVQVAIFDDNGTVRVPDFELEETGDEVYEGPAIAALNGGGFAVVYVNDALPGEGDTFGLTLRIIGPTGTVGPSIHVNTPDANANEVGPSVTVLDNGFIVVSWTRQSDNADIFARVFDSDGNPVNVTGGAGGDAPFLIRNSGQVFNDQYSSVTGLLDGQFVTTWEERTPGDGTGSQITARVQELTRSTFGTGFFSGDDLRDFLYGGSGSDQIQGRGGADFISGDAGGDILRGEEGDDLVYGGTGDDQLQGGNGADTLYGEVGFDTLLGGGGNDRLEGGADFDILRGGGDDDFYLLGGGANYDVGGGLFVFSFDEITENANEGNDTVEVQRSSSGGTALTSYTLTANVEHGNISGTAAFNLIGNALSNRLTGNAAANTLSGGDASDVLGGGGGDDTLLGGNGNDVLDGGNGNDSLSGDANEDEMSGGDGNDLLVGGSGKDVMTGGVGADVYGVEDDTDVIVEFLNEGYDVVYCSTQIYQISANVEELVMSGSALIGYGNGNSNVIWGTASTNVMSGGGGSDRLIGGGGADYFLFLSPNDFGVDLVTDFSRVEGDQIGIGASAFQFGQIVNGATFITGSVATQAYQQLIYNSAAGLLYYDPDGTGAQAAFALAQFTGAPVLSASDFTLV